MDTLFEIIEKTNSLQYPDFKRQSCLSPTHNFDQIELNDKTGCVLVCL